MKKIDQVIRASLLYIKFIVKFIQTFILICKCNYFLFVIFYIYYFLFDYCLYISLFITWKM